MEDEILKRRRKDYFDSLKPTVHRHKKRKLSDQSHAFTSKQIDAIKTILEKDRNKHLHRGLSPPVLMIQIYF